MRSIPVTVVAAASALLWNNLIGPALAPSPRTRAAANAAVAVGSTVVAGRLGLRDLGLNRSGFRVGAAAASLPLTAYAVVGAVPALRTRFVGRPEGAPAEWLLFRIPVGTVLTEELLFRSVLYTLSRSAFGPHWSRAFDSVVFGLWHWRVAGGSFPTIAFTGVSATAFDELRRRGGGVIAPAMFHFAVNGGGALLRVVNADGAQ
ncbi:lysostaphin resistance A-like protein [Actinomycetes bacterium M1A6_2h]